MKLGLGLGALALIPEGLLRAQQTPLIQRPIPSTGETIPVVGIGTARRYDVGPSVAARGRLPDARLRHRMEEFIDRL